MLGRCVDICRGLMLQWRNYWWDYWQLYLYSMWCRIQWNKLPNSRWYYKSFYDNFFIECFVSACVATTTSTDDGTNGEFYCINGGTSGETSGNCTCTPCGAGYSGRNCQTADGTIRVFMTIFL